jgi:hypothetical protein
VAVAYSVTSELALMAGSRGDLAAERLRASETSNIARDRYLAAKTELARLQPSRTVLELEALVGAFRPICRTVKGAQSCSKPVPLIAELARAKRREELEGVLARTGAEVSSGPAVAVADPSSSALVTYLSALGIGASESVVAQWLALVPVLALELGSALAGVLVASLGHRRVTVLESVNLALPAPAAIERDKVANQLLSHLRANGGSLRGSHRTLGKMLSADRNTVSRALNSLAASGRIAVTSSKAGTALRLVG